MKQTIKTSRTAGYLEKIFRALNEHYFDGVIEEPVITIQSTPRAYGHVTVAKAWQRADGGARHELNIGAGTLDRPIENVTATVLHEMVHLFNLQAGIQDTSRGGTYHNKRFREAAEVSYNRFIKALLLNDVEAMNEFINKVALHSFSSFDIANGVSDDDAPERFYHPYDCPCCLPYGNP